MRLPILLFLSFFLVSDHQAVAQTFSYEKIPTVGEIDFNNNPIVASADKILYGVYDEEMQEYKLLLQDFHGSAVDIRPALIGKGTDLGSLTMSLDARVAAIRETEVTDKDGEFVSKLCEVIIYSAPTGVAVVDQWTRQAIDHDAFRSCGASLTFLEDGRLIYFKQEDSALNVVVLSSSSVKRSFLVQSFSGDVSYPILERRSDFGGSFIFNANTNYIVSNFGVRSADFSVTYVYVDLISGSVFTADVALDLLESHLIYKLFDDFSLLVGSGRLTSNRVVDSLNPSSGETLLWSNFFQQPYLIAGSTFKPESVGAVINKQFVPLTCMTSGLKFDSGIQDVIREFSDGSLLVRLNDGLAILTRRSLELKNSRCSEISVSLSSGCSGAYRKLSLAGEIAHRVGKYPKDKLCTVTVRVRTPESAPDAGVSGEAVIEKPPLRLATFKSNSKGVAHFKLPLRALAKNKNDLVITVRGDRKFGQTKNFTIKHDI